jgi:hypothetical protein
LPSILNAKHPIYWLQPLFYPEVSKYHLHLVTWVSHSPHWVLTIVWPLGLSQWQDGLEAVQPHSNQTRIPSPNHPHSVSFLMLDYHCCFVQHLQDWPCSATQSRCIDHFSSQATTTTWYLVATTTIFPLAY